MEQILHGCAATTAALRRTIQNSQESLKTMADRFLINVKTVAKWRRRTSVKDSPMCPRESHSTVLTANRRLSPPDALAARRLPICFAAEYSKSHALIFALLPESRLPEIKGDKPIKKNFKQYPTGYFHIDIAEVSTEEGRLYLFVAIDRTSKFAYAELHLNQTRDTACQFLRQLIAVVPYHIHTILTDVSVTGTESNID